MDNTIIYIMKGRVTLEFKLRINANRPTAGDLVVTPETPLSGVEFIEIFGKTIRRSIDHIGRHRHITLGSLAVYELNVPQQIAIDSGLFTKSDTVDVYAENGLLNNFIFYSASISYAKSHRPYYPYMQNEATLISMIDELSFIDAWITTGYALELKMINGIMVNGNTLCNPRPETPETNPGIGCNGCTCEPDHNSCIKPDCSCDYHHSVRPLKPTIPPGLNTDGDDCYCESVFKPGTIIIDPVDDML